MTTRSAITPDLLTVPRAALPTAQTSLVGLSREAMRLALTELHQWRVAAREPAHLERPTVILR